ncbi:hypothetical protein MACH01_08470 [Thalassospira tepidiphila]|nr:hypothetical protein MACH01_08470 [Thalassospira tepidiphila]
MANAGFLVQLGLFAAIVDKVIWPPEWVGGVIHLPQVATFAIYSCLWFLIHYYARWQMINKRIAAILYAAYEDSERDLVTLGEDQLSVEPFATQSEAEPVKPRVLLEILNKFIYIPNTFQKSDTGTAGLPTFIAQNIINRYKIGTGAVSLEVLMALASWTMYLIVTVKIFLAN